MNRPENILREPMGRKVEDYTIQGNKGNACADSQIIAILEVGKVISIIADQLDELNGNLGILALYFEKKGREEGLLTDEDLKPESEGNPPDPLDKGE